MEHERAWANSAATGAPGGGVAAGGHQEDNGTRAVVRRTHQLIAEHRTLLEALADDPAD